MDAGSLTNYTVMTLQADAPPRALPLCPNYVALLAPVSSLGALPLPALLLGP